MQKKRIFKVLFWSLCVLISTAGAIYWFSKGYDSAYFQVKGSKAFMFGVIDNTTPEKFRSLIRNNKGLKTIVMVDVPGSVDDVANLEAGRILRASGLRTHVPEDGVIASGGVDFYLGGAVRTFDKGAKFGVHSWYDFDEKGKKIVATDLPVKHKMHQLYLSYYRDVEVDEKFYWFTLKAAPAESIYWMSERDIETYQFRRGVKYEE